MILKYAVFAISTLLITACASTELSEAGKLVRTVNKFPSNCEYLGEITESVHRKIERETYGEGALGEINLRNKASAIGGDTVQISVKGVGPLHGQAYRCSRLPASTEK